MNKLLFDKGPNPLRLKSFQEHQFISSKKKSSPYLVVCLHGQGGSLLDLRKIRARIRIDDFSYLFINGPYIRSTDEGRDGFEWHGSRPKHREGINLSLQKLDELATELAAFGFHSSKMLLFGFSQGAVIALEWALRGKDRFFGVIAVSGWIFDVADLMENLGPHGLETPILMTHGPCDEVISFEELKPRVEQVSLKLSNLSFEEIQKGHEIHSSEYELFRAWAHRRISRAPLINPLSLGI